MLHEDIQTDLQSALESGNKLRLSVLRNIKSEIINELISRGEDRDSLLEDEGVIEVVARLAKQRRESIEEFEAGGREELAKQERDELSVLEEYLPEQMDDEELQAIIDSVIADVGAEDMSDMGKVMGKAMSEVGPETDGNRVKKMVQSKLQ